jgi:hypothetical protein
LDTTFSLFWISQSKVVSLAPNPQPGGRGLSIYVLQWQGGPVVPPDAVFPFFLRLLRFAGLRWRYSNPPPHGTRQDSTQWKIILLLNNIF